MKRTLAIAMLFCSVAIAETGKRPASEEAKKPDVIPEPVLTPAHARQFRWPRSGSKATRSHAGENGAVIYRTAPPMPR
jgi:hypothetical protein